MSTVVYHCGHEEWAKRGVLLLNAALTIPEGAEYFDHIKEHCEIWKPFMSILLETWINKTKFEENVFVVLLGDFAVSLWKSCTVNNKNVKEQLAHHPTFPKEQIYQTFFQKEINNFLTEAPKHFKEIIKIEEYQDIFNTSTKEEHGRKQQQQKQVDVDNETKKVKGLKLTK